MAALLPFRRGRKLLALVAGLAAMTALGWVLQGYPGVKKVLIPLIAGGEQG